MKSVTIGTSETVPALGQGTWYMGDDARNKDDEIAALRRGVELGMTLIDTAELYGSGRSETLVGEAFSGMRDDVFLVSKVLPYNASEKGTIASCEMSLKRLGTDRLDLFLLHWPGTHPLEETVEAFEKLQKDGKIRYWGVSNFNSMEMAALSSVSGGDKVATNQVLYNLTRRGIEWDQLPSAERKGLPTMAYSPIEQARLLADSKLQTLASDLGLTTAQLALAWVLRREHMIAIPKAGKVAHVEENAKAAEIELTQDTLDTLDQMFPPPTGPSGLDIL
ncbi:Aldo/keto reductase [Cohaesibacter sp. ES.047]|uniref:aldo/keto reductase n=1 Tax=Cohaesibacter sp. ES.047 TaxID=1798205 RepID=UPI000BB738EE|nr:aldo/keto reductase [Cohaesibacter sp. ES.047]SNY93824.1 Aldo/keto reductase [Cohaesibacter sp. ES.047]